MAIVNLRQASAYLGFRTTTTLRRLLQAGELCAYVRSGPDLRATYLDVAPKGRPFGATSRYVALRSGPERTYAHSSPACSSLLSVVVVLKPK